jgi:hypothetical protein
MLILSFGLNVKYRDRLPVVLLSTSRQISGWCLNLGSDVREVLTCNLSINALVKSKAVQIK